jgi:hypothetical protein
VADPDSKLDPNVIDTTAAIFTQMGFFGEDIKKKDGTDNLKSNNEFLANLSGSPGDSDKGPLRRYTRRRRNVGDARRLVILL